MKKFESMYVSLVCNTCVTRDMLMWQLLLLLLTHALPSYPCCSAVQPVLCANTTILLSMGPITIRHLH